MTRFPHRELVDEVARLGMPHPNEVVIGHGSALVIRGIREAREGGDIDLITSMENIRYLMNARGFMAAHQSGGVNKRRGSVAYHDPHKRFDVHAWDFSVSLRNETGKGRIGLERLIASSDQDEPTGIWVARPELVLLTKLETGRPKDADDIRAIRAYQGRHKGRLDK